MALKIAEGASLKWTNSTGVAVASGQAVVVGDILCVTEGAYASNEVGVVHTRGVFALPKKQEAMAQGKKVYWDADGNPHGGVTGSGCLTLTPTGNTFVGIVYEAAGANDETVEVSLAN